MRTTLSDSLANELRAIAQETGKPFKQVVNEILSIGLQHRKQAKPYCLKPVKLGQTRPGIDLDKALQLADTLGDEAMITKLEQQR